ncbi:hypothetical protein NDU88_006130 [Pleurodeles waltl]|uniref:Uncharacterized protein n=1 Tax=Pleurodeles waltl TaxID=8319 RepID=A0AAV7MBC0_PLEWA|nr:hypothetical protein NDU88_006130 [Pleurodeles waltl]
MKAIVCSSQERARQRERREKAIARAGIQATRSCRRLASGPSTPFVTSYWTLVSVRPTSWNTEECTVKLMCTLIKHAKPRMDLQTAKIEELLKETEEMREQEEVKMLLRNMEEKIKKHEEETRMRRVHKFNRDKLDY